MSAIEGVVAYQRWSLRGVPLYTSNILHVVRAGGVAGSVQSVSTAELSQ